MISTVFPFLIASNELLLPPMLVAGIFLFITLNYRIIKRIYLNFERVHYWIKIQYFWFIAGLVTASALLYENITSFIPDSFFVGALYLIINAIWFNKINTKMTEGRNRIILKNYTNETSRTLDFEPYLIPIVLALLVTFTIASLQSLIATRAQSFLVVETLYWSFPVFILTFYFIIDILVIEQIEWYPPEGITTWKEFDFDSTLPSIDDPQKLAQYTYWISHLDSPPAEFEEYIEKNFHSLVKKAQELPYLPFQIQYGRAMGNWGRAARSQIHFYVAIVLASISQYRFLGLIPLYKRKMFYEMLQAIAMTGSMTQDWRELIQFEVMEKKDEYFVLDWVLGSRYLPVKYDPEWIVSWEGEIYKGKTGYYEAVQKMELFLHIRPEMDAWEVDIWELSREYVRVYIGEDARHVASTNLQFYEQLLFMSKKRSSKEYIKEKAEYQESLLHSTNRLVSVKEDRAPMTESEKKRRILAYFDEESFSFTPPPLTTVLKEQLTRKWQEFNSMNMSQIGKYTLFSIIFLINLLIILGLEQLFQGDVGLFVIGVEVVLLFFFSITPSNADMTISTDIQAMGSVLNTSTLNQNAVTVNNASITGGIRYILYGIVLLICYRLFSF